jgi:hypothetical protein
MASKVFGDNGASEAQPSAPCIPSYLKRCISYVGRQKLEVREPAFFHSKFLIARGLRCHVIKVLRLLNRVLQWLLWLES